MSRDDETGAITAAKYFFLELYPYVEFTQDTAAWRAMSHADCIFCKSVLETVATKQASGTVTAVAPMTIHSTEVHEVNPLMFTVTLDIDTGPDEDFNLDGVSLSRTTKVSGTVIIIVVRRGTEWVTRGVDLKQRP